MKARSICARVPSFLIFTILFALTISAQSDDLKGDLRSSFTKFDLIRINSGGELRVEGSTRTLSIASDEQNLELVVEPNDILSSRYLAEDTNVVGVTKVERPAVTTYKGMIAGVPGSKVRLTIDGEKVEGFFEDSSGRRFIEPASKYSSLAEPGDSVIYRAEDSLHDATYICESDIPGKLEFGRELLESDSVNLVMAVRVVELATEADAEWVSVLGGAAAANNEIISILNMVEGTFNNEVNLSIRVVYQHTWSVSDPFGAGDLNGVLSAFVSHWNANFGSVQRDVAHLFSAKAVAQGRGLAYVGVICRAPAYSYGVSGRVAWAPGKYLVPAHEIGHNLGADHADSAQGCANTLMNPTVTNTTALSFCPFSRNSITAYVSTNGSCLSEGAPPAPVTGSAMFDFDGDRRSDISVFRPSNGVWYLSRSTAGFTSFRFGLAGDKAVAADYDGDGRTDAAVFRAGVWYRLRSSTNTMDTTSFGLPNDVPSPADFDGDGRADVGVFRSSTGVWYSLASSNGAFASTQFGVAGDVPIAGDYDGDGKDDINLFRPSSGTWYRLNSSNGSFSAIRFGLSGDKPMAGDFDGDNKADIAVWRPSSGAWYATYSSNGGFFATVFGLLGDIPSPADYDGDSKTDVSVFRPSNGTWYRLHSSDGSFGATAFGLSGDNPIPSQYVY